MTPPCPFAATAKLPGRIYASPTCKGGIHATRERSGRCKVPRSGQDRSLQNHNALLLLFHQNLDHGFSYVVTAFAFAAGLVQLAGEEDGKPPAAQNAADVLGTGLEAAVGGFVERALVLALGRPAPMLAAGQVDLQVGIAAVVLERSAVGICLLYTSPSPRDLSTSRMPSSA